MSSRSRRIFTLLVLTSGHMLEKPGELFWWYPCLSPKLRDLDLSGREHVFILKSPISQALQPELRTTSFGLRSWPFQRRLYCGGVFASHKHALMWGLGHISAIMRTPVSTRSTSRVTARCMSPVPSVPQWGRSWKVVPGTQDWGSGVLKGRLCPTYIWLCNLGRHT
jgi:hypothetical protein